MIKVKKKIIPKGRKGKIVLKRKKVKQISLENMMHHQFSQKDVFYTITNKVFFENT